MGGADVRSSELPGHPSDARVLIVNCDDLGMHEDIDVAAVESTEVGVAKSGSLTAVGSSAGRATGRGTSTTCACAGPTTRS